MQLSCCNSDVIGMARCDNLQPLIARAREFGRVCIAPNAQYPPAYDCRHQGCDLARGRGRDHRRQAQEATAGAVQGRRPRRQAFGTTTGPVAVGDAAPRRDGRSRNARRDRGAETNQSLTARLYLWANIVALGGGAHGKAVVIRGGRAGHRSSARADQGLPKIRQTQDRRPFGCGANACRDRRTGIDPAALPVLRGLLDGAAVDHSTPCPIMNLAAGISVTCSSRRAVSSFGRQMPRRMRETCTRLTPTFGARVPSCSAGFRSIQDCKAVIGRMYARRTFPVKGDVRPGAWKR